MKGTPYQNDLSGEIERIDEQLAEMQEAAAVDGTFSQDAENEYQRLIRRRRRLISRMRSMIRSA